MGEYEVKTFNHLWPLNEGFFIVTIYEENPIRFRAEGGVIKQTRVNEVGTGNIRNLGVYESYDEAMEGVREYYKKLSE